VNRLSPETEPRDIVPRNTVLHRRKTLAENGVFRAWIPVDKQDSQYATPRHPYKSPERLAEKYSRAPRAERPLPSLIAFFSQVQIKRHYNTGASPRIQFSDTILQNSFILGDTHHTMGVATEKNHGYAKPSAFSLHRKGGSA
jgi:hypothetical protein